RRLFTSVTSSATLKRMLIVPVPALSDNYSYLLVDTNTNKAAAIDPVNPEGMTLAAQKYGAKIEAILTTHHHNDHAGGNKVMKTLLPETTPVYGGDDRILAITHKVGDNDVINIGDLTIKVLLSPAHTTGHVLYYVSDKKDTPCLFTGDTLFIAGCGRLFEGSPAQMYHALYNVIGSLPDDTLVYCGHEYTYKNLLFAKSLEPNNQDILVRNMLEWTEKQLEEKKPTVPSTIGKEKSFNPFMRVHLPSVAEHLLKDVPGSSPEDVLGHIRKLKDSFQPN
ncbi:hypothetical protein SAMD00019534_047170, partial [Acytostelium subglobosum LB1]|uniref:hypothetical protein n=1 Tax=Acytostelium subglobosum LB1 TaxID=1410327 RepID=UPI000644DAE5